MLVHLAVYLNNPDVDIVAQTPSSFAMAILYRTAASITNVSRVVPPERGNVISAVPTITPTTSTTAEVAVVRWRLDIAIVGRFGDFVFRMRVEHFAEGGSRNRAHVISRTTWSHDNLHSHSLRSIAGFNPGHEFCPAARIYPAVARLQASR